MKIKKLNITYLALTGLLLASPTAAFAGAESGFYVGYGLGTSTIEDKGTDGIEGNYNFKESDTGTKLFGGYNFGLIPFFDFAVEASYVDFGNPNAQLISANSINYKLTGISTFGLVGMSFGPISIFAKAGAINWDSKANIGVTSTSLSGTDTAYGLGAKFQISSFAIRTEYEVFDISALSQVTMTSVSGVYTF